MAKAFEAIQKQNDGRGAREKDSKIGHVPPRVESQDQLPSGLTSDAHRVPYRALRFGVFRQIGEQCALNAHWNQLPDM